ncbi:ANR family transcriptional regulator (plasmid) [Enterobacter roggenkampii]|uniref:ANR family transcriptional regulator n=1 Tax=Enterobacter roggenkampii TaxID=1812935 RepID=UPI0011BFDF52|nr:ANR family transcriptional regulator [Enterobacter roggenkampii]
MQDNITHFGFRELADIASEMERCGEYLMAADVWEKAHMCAIKNENRIWALARSMVCRKRIPGPCSVN